MTETADYSQQTTLQLPSSELARQPRSDRQSPAGSQTLSTTGTATGTAATGGTAGADGVTGSVGGEHIVINIDEKQPLICRPDHVVTIDAVYTPGVPTQRYNQPYCSNKSV